MQSSKQIEKIILDKIHSVRNKKVIKDMQIALNNMEKENEINKRFAFLGIGLTLLLLITYLINYF